MDKIREYMNLITPEQWSNEEYKYDVPGKAKDRLSIELWETWNEIIIHKRAMDALDRKISENLLSTFAGLTYKNSVEELNQKRQLAWALKTLFLGNDAESAFGKLKHEAFLNYTVSAYYMFIYDSNIFMPLRMSMNIALEELGYPLLETDYSWGNYNTYNDNLRDIMKKANLPNLLAAHSFVWIVRTMIKEGKGNVQP